MTQTSCTGINFLNFFASGFKWQQSTFACDILFTRHLNFSTWFLKKLILWETNKIK